MKSKYIRFLYNNIVLIWSLIVVPIMYGITNSLSASIVGFFIGAICKILLDSPRIRS